MPACRGSVRAESESLLASPRFSQRAIDSAVLVRQQLALTSPCQQLAEEGVDYLSLEQAVIVFTEHGGIPGGVLHIEPRTAPKPQVLALVLSTAAHGAPYRIPAATGLAAISPVESAADQYATTGARWGDYSWSVASTRSTWTARDGPIVPAPRARGRCT